MSQKYRLLLEGERVKRGDECRLCSNDRGKKILWVPVAANRVGCIAPNPSYVGATQYRRAER